jgi:hypothetical protein
MQYEKPINGFDIDVTETQHLTKSRSRQAFEYVCKDQASLLLQVFPSFGRKFLKKATPPFGTFDQLAQLVFQQTSL